MEDKPTEEKKDLLQYLENKSLLYKLKRWEKNILKFLKNLFYKDQKTKDHLKKMEEHKQQFDEELKKENTNYEK